MKVRTRERRLTIRVTLAELRQLRRAASDVGVALSTLVRECVFQNPHVKQHGRSDDDARQLRLRGVP